MIHTWWDLFWLIVVVTLAVGLLIMVVGSCIEDIVKEIKK
jgi:hypothetical protein